MGRAKFTVNQHGHINNSTIDARGSVSSAPTGIVASTVVVAVGAATATFTVTSTEGFTVGDTVNGGKTHIHLDPEGHLTSNRTVSWKTVAGGFTMLGTPTAL